MDDGKGQGGPAAPQPDQGAGKARWLIWSREHTAFSLSQRMGYTVNLDEAGRFETAAAVAIVKAKRGMRPGELAPELMILAPECAPGDLLLDTLSTADLDAIAAFLACTGLDVDGNTHGTLSIGRLVQMLLEDVALMIHRPGSWEGAGMASLMSGHGYRYHQGATITRAVHLRYWGGKSPYDTEPQP